MTPETSARYQPPDGNIFKRLESQYGTGAALVIARAAASQDDEAVQEAIAQVRSGPRLDDSTLSNFWTQVTTDPLEAPLTGLNNQIGNAVGSVFKNPWVVLVLAAAAFYYFRRAFK